LIMTPRVPLFRAIRAGAPIRRLFSVSGCKWSAKSAGPCFPPTTMSPRSKPNLRTRSLCGITRDDTSWPEILAPRARLRPLSGSIFATPSRFGPRSKSRVPNPREASSNCQTVCVTSDASSETVRMFSAVRRLRVALVSNRFLGPSDNTLSRSHYRTSITNNNPDFRVVRVPHTTSWLALTRGLNDLDIRIGVRLE